MTAKELAGQAARIAAYGSATVRTPADLSWREALELAAKHDAPKQTKKRKRYEQAETVHDEALGPIFENEVSQ